jgi:hypothetical protein
MFSSLGSSVLSCHYDSLGVMAAMVAGEVPDQHRLEGMHFLRTIGTGSIAVRRDCGLSTSCSRTPISDGR